MTYISEMALDRNHLISQIVESINKMKNSFIADKVIVARQLSSGDVLITTNTTTTKEELERDLT